jgi:hypothetical protein
VQSLDKPEIKIWRHWRHHYNKTYLTTLRVKYLRILCSAAAGLLVCCLPHYCAWEVVVWCRQRYENSDKEKTNDSTTKWQLQISGHATYVLRCRGIVLVDTCIIHHFTLSILSLCISRHVFLWRSQFRLLVRSHIVVSRGNSDK